MQFAVNEVIPVTLVPGDGIGPEIVEATVTVLDALHAPFAWDVHQAGMAGLIHSRKLFQSLAYSERPRYSVAP